MAGNMGILPSRHIKIENSGHRLREIGRLASTLARRYDFRELGGYLGNVGLERMGYNVEFIVAGYTTQFEALQDGSLTATLEIWQFTGREQLERALASGNVDMYGR